MPDSAAKKTQEPHDDPVDVVVSYSHSNQAWKEWLLEGITGMSTTLGYVRVKWDDCLEPSDDWYGRITGWMDAAKVFLCLVSEEYVASDFIRNEELGKALERREEQSEDERARLLWVPLEKVELEGPAKVLEDVQAAWNPARPLAEIRHREELLGAREHIQARIRQALDPFGARIRELLPARYELIRELRGGRTTKTYQARDHTLKRWVAVRVLRSNDRWRRDEFDARLRMASAIGMLERCMSIHEAWTAEDPAFCITQFIDGGRTLRSRLDSWRSVNVEYARDIFCKLLQAALSVHRHGHCHLNIRPETIVLARNDDLYLTPFGCEQIQYRGNGRRRYKSGEARADYPVIPELAEAAVSRAALPYCDQYMIGLVGYELFTGKTPGPKPDPLDPGDLPGCPESWLLAINTMIAAKPEHRFPSLEIALERLADKNVHVAIAKISYRALLASGDGGKELFDRFYTRLIEASETAEKAFRKAFKEAERRDKQIEKLKQALLYLVVYADYHTRGDPEPTILTHVARDHKERGFPRRDFELFKKLLVEEIARWGAEDPAVKLPREVLETAWENTLKDGIEYMCTWESESTEPAG